ncbi:Response regulator receiver:transcriptional regulatory protein [Pseudomonas meliae]|uniref:Response regulator receiver:transcriptional regulatory protein n=1 Tax=Pseudomonas meliae TaxID=86176 RepID=A0A0P9UHE4_9PSED|nr:Response regulator receiver:transcriptional regulatory protein [Pseudomonas meliae]
MIFNSGQTTAAHAGDRSTMQALPDTPLDATSTDQRWSVRALIVDDDVAIRELLCDYLTRFNINARGVTDGTQMRQALTEETFDVVVLDLMLPGEDGLSLCRWLRSTSDIPILMLTARCEPTDRIIGLELGADDYMAKPFEPRELVARIQTILRRVRDERSDQRTTIRFDAWRLNSVLRQLTAADGLVVPLSNAEFRLLRVFLERPHRVRAVNSCWTPPGADRSRRSTAASICWSRVCVRSSATIQRTRS